MSEQAVRPKEVGERAPEPAEVRESDEGEELGNPLPDRASSYSRFAESPPSASAGPRPLVKPADFISSVASPARSMVRVG